MPPSMPMPTPPSTPRTLLGMAGITPPLNPIAQSAIVIIDAQNDYRTTVPLTGLNEALARITRLLDRARQLGSPIFHVVHHGVAGGGLFDPTSPGADILPEVQPRPGEMIIPKRAPSSFTGTALTKELRATGRDRLIVAGFMTHMCVSTTVRAALDFGYRTTVVADATATRPLPDPMGGAPLAAAALQQASLAALADRFAAVVPLAALPDYPSVCPPERRGRYAASTPVDTA